MRWYPVGIAIGGIVLSACLAEGSIYPFHECRRFWYEHESEIAYLAAFAVAAVTYPFVVRSFRATRRRRTIETKSGDTER
jgi:hypothetical protein